MSVQWYVWLALVAGVAALLALDLLVFHRRPHEVSIREAGLLSAFWLALGLGFAGALWWLAGGEAAGEYLAGYVVEKSLSVDNVFVFAAVFSALAVPPALRYRVLFLGVVLAILLRAALIAAGAALLGAAGWIVYVFGAFLVATGYRFARHHHATVDLERSRALRLLRRLVPLTTEYRGGRYLVREEGRLAATPLLLALALVAVFDLVFAVDSIPAIFAITRDPFVVFAANAFALLGLRALFFLVAGTMSRVRHLDLALGAVLVFVGGKMIASDLYKVPVYVSLPVIVALLAAAFGASWLERRRGGGQPASRLGASSSAAGRAAR